MLSRTGEILQAEECLLIDKDPSPKNGMANGRCFSFPGDSEESVSENENVVSKPAVSVVVSNTPTVFRYDAFSN